MENTWKNVSLALSAMIVGALVTGIVMTVPQAMRGDAVAQDGFTGGGQAERNAVARQNLAAAEGLSSAFRNVADLLRPSVVSISSKQTAIVRRRNFPRGFDDLFNDRGQLEERELETGMGSGVIVSADGYILTNNHVVKDADDLEVELFNGKTVSGKIVGTDPETDLAVVKVDESGLQPAVFGDSEALRVGDWVLAIGSPFGLDQTVTAGIISAMHRDQNIIKNGEGFEDFLQTDAAINPGNSGGALVNLRGELVGINTAIVSRTGASAGIGFAIPSSLAKPVLNSIITSGVVRRGFLGAQVVDVTEENVRDFELAVTTGALVGGVLDGGPADKAGLQPSDVVTKLDGRPCTGGTQLRNYIAGRPPGSIVRMEVNRQGKVMTVNVHLQERTDAAMARFKAGEVMGADLTPATPEVARRYGYANLRRGLIITKIRPGSEADDAELQEGDVLESAANVALESADQLNSILEEGKKRRQTVVVTVRRRNELMLLRVRP